MLQGQRCGFAVRQVHKMTAARTRALAAKSSCLASILTTAQAQRPSQHTLHRNVINTLPQRKQPELEGKCIIASA